MKSIGRYEIKKEIARGGMATVYLGFDTRFQRSVAIKVLPRQFTHDPKFLARFELEAMIIAGLEHKSIVPVYDFGEENDSPYLVMRYMPGGTLAEKIDGQPMPLEEITGIMDVLAPALDKAHQKGIIHRDLKPGNVLFDEDGQPYLADFGIARMVEATHTMTIIGTPAYMSPEAARGDIKLDGRTDIYALGVMLFEMLTGHPPYVSDTPSGQMIKHIMDPIPDVLKLNPGLPAEATVVINTAMAKEREERYRNAAEMAAAVRGLTGMPQASAANKDKTIVEPYLAAAAASVPTPKPSSKPVAQNTVIDTSPELTPPLPASQAAVPPADGPASSKIPGWLWWLGAALLIFIVIFSIRAIFMGGSGEIDGSNEEGDNGTPSVVVFPEATVTAIPKEAAASDPDTPEPRVTIQPSSTPGPTSTTVPQETNTPRPTMTLEPVGPPGNASLGDSWQRPADGVKMVYVPGGTFTMGQEDGSDNAKPVRDVSMDAYWIDETEVTNNQFGAFVATAGYETAAEKNNRSTNWQHPLGPESVLDGLGMHPVVQVNWEDANAFCTWAGGRLPTEAEWEYAARGPESFRYPWGNTWDGRKANFCDVNCDHALGDDNVDDRYAHTAPVGSFPNGTSWTGTLDQAGNVKEWTNDWYDYYHYETAVDKNPQGPAEPVEKSWTDGDTKSTRGGSYRTFAPALNLHSAVRDGSSRLFQHNTLGFRCAF